MTTNHTLSGAWPKRKGVILLLVLAMMTFFAILVAAFMVITSQQYREAATNRKIGEFVQSPRDDLHAAILELIVGSDNNTTSDIWEYSLGATLYGDNTFERRIGNGPNGGYVAITSVINSAAIGRVGNVITFWDDDAKKYRSSRITDFNYNGTADIDGIYFVPLAHVSVPNADFVPNFNDFVYINGPAFGGRGTDYNLDYTAPDANNPFLAWIGRDSTNSTILIPSFDRSTTYPFASNNGLLVDNDGDGIPDGGWVQTSLPMRSTKDGRQYRPMFSFLVLDLDGRLNVNTHGNWLHAVEDYDHPRKNGSYVDFDADYDYTQTRVGLLQGEEPDGSPTTVLRGIGYGPAGVRLDYGLAQLLSNNISDGRTILDYLLAGRTVNNFKYPGRYGSGADPQPGKDGLKENDIADLQFAGVPQSGSLISNRVAYDGSTGVAYAGTPPDFWEDLAVIYDPLGHKSFWPKEGWLNSSNWVSISTDNPYEFTVNQKTPYDEPFTLPELEAVLRMNDLDQKNLSPRLKELLGLSNLATYDLRYNVTTISNNVPKMPVFTYQELNAGSSPPTYTTKTGNLRELIANCVSRSGGTGNVDTLMSYLINTYNLTADDRVGRPYLTESGRLDVNALLTDPDVLTQGSYTGLAKRMDFARAVYILLMALSYDQIYDDTLVVNLDPNYARDEYLNTLTGTARADACRELTAIRLAQWAVNLVDFMDPDATMTPFVFDINPFDGWNAPHNYLDPSTGIINQSSLQNAINTSGAHLVWGLEPSDLLITETFAFHDRRVANTKTYSPIGMTPATPTEDKYKYVYDKLPTDPGYDLETAEKHDKRFDQVRIPEGSAFIELYNAGNPNRPSYPSNMYDSTGRLDLNALAGNVSGGYPVWRLVVGESTDPMNGRSRQNFDGTTLGFYDPSTNPRVHVFDTATSKVISTGRENNIVYKNMQYPATFSFQPEQYYDESINANRNRGSLLGANALPGFQDIKIDRIVWLHNALLPTSHKDSDRIFRNVEGTSTLGPNEYLIVGPRLKTAIGAATHASGNYGYPANRKIELDSQKLPTGVSPAKYICAAMVTNPTVTTDPVTPVITSWTRTARIGFNISEPMPRDDFYYDEPEYFNLGNANVRDCYASNMKDPSTCKTEPMDALTSPNDFSGRPVADDHLVFQDGTAPLYKSLFLQRVADPDRPYDEITNPYISVDWAMFDLTVFNGERTPDEEKCAVAYDNVTPFLDTPPAEGTVFVSRQWGHKDMMPANQYPALPNPRARFLTPVHSGNIFQMELKLPSGAGVQPNFNTTNFYDFFKKSSHMTLGYLNEMVLSDGSAVTPRTDTGLYNGAPSTPFLHLPWNDAPLANPYEVMQVPASSPGRLGIEFIDQENSAGVKKPYEAVSFGTDGRFAHLLNFFSQVNEPEIIADPGNNIDAAPGRSALNLAPLLDCVFIPSRFLGTRDWYDLSGNPYSVSRYREPGLINLNTMTESTFYALMGGRTTVGYPDFDSARNTDWFRGISSEGVNSSLLRKSTAGNYPLFAGNYSNDLASMNGLGANTYNMLEGLQRLSSMTTTTSNTFAVWVTLGYFDASTGNELGSETGEITRHRAFYILDRSIPFGYSRGKKLNAEDIILLRRFIE